MDVYASPATGGMLAVENRLICAFVQEEGDIVYVPDGYFQAISTLLKAGELLSESQDSISDLSSSIIIAQYNFWCENTVLIDTFIPALKNGLRGCPYRLFGTETNKKMQKGFGARYFHAVANLANWTVAVGQQAPGGAPDGFVDHFGQSTRASPPPRNPATMFCRC